MNQNTDAWCMLRMLVSSLLLIGGVASGLPAAEEDEAWNRGRPLSVWIQELNSPDPQVCLRALQAVAAIGPDAQSAAPTVATRHAKKKGRPECPAGHPEPTHIASLGLPSNGESPVTPLRLDLFPMR